MKKNAEFQKLCYVKMVLNMMSAGVKVTDVKVNEIAQSINAPNVRWTAKGLLNWVNDKMFIMALSKS